MLRGRNFLIALAVTLLGAAQLDAQATGTITGRAVDAMSGQPLEGVTLQVAGRSALSASNGQFLITGVPTGSQTITATRVGYAVATVDVSVVSGQTVTVTIRMDSEALMLEGIVVTSIGYGERSERDLTGVIERIGAEDFNQGRIVSPQQLIQGKVAGVQIIDSGEPGGGVSIRIRGGTSVNASNDPLYVVDGVPLPPGGGTSAGRDPLNFLNPQDIESVTVLKDASATAIYGSRGANGVVIIETKKGVAGGEAGASMIYNGSVSSSNVIGDISVLNAEQFRAAVSQQAPDALASLGSANTDWRDAVQQAGRGQEHSLAVTGGTEDMDYRLSVGYLNQKGVVKGSETERVNLSLNLSQLLLDEALSVEMNVKGSRAEDLFTPGSVLGESGRMAPTQPIMDPGSPWGGYFEWADPLGPNNPIASLDLESDAGTTYRSVLSAKADYETPFLDGLVATVNVAYDVSRTERRFFAPSFLRGQAESGFPGIVSRTNNTSSKSLLDAYVNYETFVGGDLDFTAGYSFEEQRNDFPSFDAQGLSFDLLGANGIPASDQVRSFLRLEENRLVSFFGRANYSYDDRFLLTASVRRDGSSQFGPDQQWGTFPSAAAAWRLSNESFFADADFLSDLKLRVSWGINGNQVFDPYQQYSSYLIGDSRSQAQFGDDYIPTIRPSAADPGIKWEETTSYNVGFDFGLFDDRVTGSVDYYKKDTEDLIFTVPVAAGTNLSNFVTTNIGAMKNTGVEFGVNALVFEGAGDGFYWDAGLNLSMNDNELQRINLTGTGDETILTGGISGGVGSNIQVLKPGYPVNSFFVYTHKLGPDGKPVHADTNGDGSINENDLYEDINGDGVVNQDDRAPFKSPTPDLIVGHTSYMTYGNFDASFTLLAYVGNYVYNNVASNLGNYRELSTSSVPVNLHTSVLEYGFYDPQYFSDVYVEDGSFLRMDNISLGYAFDSGPLEGMRVFGSVQNVFTFTGYSGIDPLAGVNGIDNNIYPRARTFTAGLNVAF